jgi:hypothetical protein
MDHAHVVRCGDGGGCRGADGGGGRDAGGPTRVEHVREILAVDELHRDEDARPVRAELVHRDDAGVSEHGHDARLAREPGLRLARPRRRRDLERDEPAEPLIAREEDLAHATGAQALQDLERADDRAAVEPRRGGQLNPRRRRRVS